jgi:hypothetical protein
MDDLRGHAQRTGAEPGVPELVGPARVIEEVLRDERQVDVARLLDRLAVVERLQHGQLAGALLDDPRDPEQVLPPLGRRHRRPHPLERAPRGGEGPVHVGLAGRGHLRQRLLVGRIDGDDALVALGRHEVAVDEQVVRRPDGHDGT